MKAVGAHVRNGQIVLDEPDRAELEAAVEESVEQFERGEFEDARAFAVRLLARL